MLVLPPLLQRLLRVLLASWLSGAAGARWQALVEALLEWQGTVGITEDKFVELHGPKAVFDRLDLNHDGVLSGHEAELGLHSLQALPAGAEWQRITSSPGNRGGGGSSNLPHALESGSHDRPSGMDFELFSRVSPLPFLVVSLHADVEWLSRRCALQMLEMDKHKPRDPGFYFSRLDENEDGVIDKLEFRKMADLVDAEV